jgi:hypothetical protein
LVIEVGGLRLLTDPTFDQPGPFASGTRTLTTTRPPAVTAAEIGLIDNLDRRGRDLLEQVPLALTNSDGVALRSTDVPARHGPDGGTHLTGFVLSGVDSDKGDHHDKH